MRNIREPIFLITLSLLARASNFLSAILIYHLASSDTFVQVSWYVLIASLISLFSGLGFSNFLLKFIFYPKTYLRTSFLMGINKIFSIWIFMFMGLNLFMALNKSFLPMEKPWAINFAVLEGIIGAVSTEVIYNSLMAKSNVRELIKFNLLLITINGPFRIILFLIFNQSLLIWAVIGVAFKIVVVAYFLRNLWKEIDFADISSHKTITYSVVSGYLLFPIFSIGQWLTANIDKYIGTDYLKAEELANYQLTFQFTTLIGMVISQVDLYFLPNLYNAYSKKNLKYFVQLQLQATTLAGIAMSSISTLSWYFLIKDNSEKWFEILLLMSMAQIFYVPVAVYASIMTKIKHETNKLFYAPYISIGLIVPFVLLYVDKTQASNLAITYFFLSLFTMIIVLVSDSLYGENVIFKALVNPRFLSFPVIILVYCGSIYLSSKYALVVILIVISSLILSLQRFWKIFRKVGDHG